MANLLFTLRPETKISCPRRIFKTLSSNLIKAKTDLASAEEDITQWAIQRDRWKLRAEAAEERRLRLDKKDRQRNRSSGRSDDEETRHSFAESVQLLRSEPKPPL